MAFSHVVYVDEAGDEGFGKLKSDSGNKSGQSQWLLIGAAIVRGEDDAKLPEWRNAILDRFPNAKRRDNAKPRDLHFRDFKHEKKIVVCQELAQLPIKSCVTFSNKRTIPGSNIEETFKELGYLYNYLTRWLLERVTSYCDVDAKTQGYVGNIKVVFSRRSGTNYQEMKAYLSLIKNRKEVMPPRGFIDWSVFDPDNIVVENHSKWAGLQIADAITSAYFKAVEPNFYGNYETKYAEILRSNAIRGGEGKVLNVGVTPVPGLDKCQANKFQKEFFLSFDK